MHDAFVPASNEWMPEGAYNQAALRYPWLFLSLCPSYLGLTGGILDTTAAYLRGELPGQTTGARRDHPVSSTAGRTCSCATSSHVRFSTGRSTRPARSDRGRPGHRLGGGRTVMEHAAEVASTAIRVLRRPVDDEVAPARTHVPRRSAGLHDAAVER